MYERSGRKQELLLLLGKLLANICALCIEFILRADGHQAAAAASILGGVGLSAA